MFYIDPSDAFDVSVQGASGTLSIQEVGSPFFGFHDPLGIESVTIMISAGGSGNFSFDDITTAQVPEPGSGSLLALGLALLAGRRARSPR